MIHKGSPRWMGTYFRDTFSCYIENMSVPEGSKGRKIPILFSPSNLSDNVQASFNQTAIPGSSAPAITYSGTGARVVSFELFIPIDYLPPNTDFANTEEYLNAFRALVYPMYVGTIIKPPHCVLHLTNIEIDGVCTQCNISYKMDANFGSDGALGANVTLSFLEVLEKALSTADVSGRTTILKNTDVGYYSEALFNDRNKNRGRTTYDWSLFKLKGEKTVRTDFEKIRTDLDPQLDQFIPSYLDEGCSTGTGDFSVVRFYYVSATNIKFTGNDILGENGENKSAIYKICIDGDSYNTSTKELVRNQIPDLTRQQIQDLVTVGSDMIYYYIIYTPYLGLDRYDFSKALIRTLYCDAGSVIEGDDL